MFLPLDPSIYLYPFFLLLSLYLFILISVFLTHLDTSIPSRYVYSLHLAGEALASNTGGTHWTPEYVSP